MSPEAPPETENEGFVLSRQPIVAGENRLVGWELAFDSAEGQVVAESEDRSEAYFAATMGLAKAAR